jgi:hypothetical protein
MVKQLSHDSWAVECRECLVTGGVPIGIGLPVGSLVAAESMRDNHRRTAAPAANSLVGFRR